MLKQFLERGLAERGVRELGYVDGRNMVMERRYAEGRQERLHALAEELVRLNVDVIVTGSNPVVAAVKQTTKMPIVMGVSRDPVGAGFVASLARPGGNITGLSNDSGPEIHAKNLEILKEMVPGLLASPISGTPSLPARRATGRWSRTPPGDWA